MEEAAVNASARGAVPFQREAMMLSARGVAFDAGAHAITVPAADGDGFAVTLRVIDPRKFVVEYDG